MEFERHTFDNADLVYANLEGLLVTSQGPEIDIPDKKGPGDEGQEVVLLNHSATTST